MICGLLSIRSSFWYQKYLLFCKSSLHFSFILALVHLPSTLFLPYSFPSTLSNCFHLSFSLVFPWYCDRKVGDLGCSVLKPVGKIPRACAENGGAIANKQSTQTHSQTLNGPWTRKHTQPQSWVSATRYRLKIANSRHYLYSKQIEVIEACMLRLEESVTGKSSKTRFIHALTCNSALSYTHNNFSLS